jgi:transcriptional regulator with XRE-family HTH domain
MPGASEPTQDNPAGGQGAPAGNPASAAAAQGAGEPTPDGDGGDDLQGLSQEELAKIVKKLRVENANRRTTAKALEGRLTTSEETLGKLKQALGIEKDDVSPEEKVKAFEAQLSASQLEIGIQQLAIQHGVTGDQFEYFQFLFHKQLEALGEEEEMSEDAVSQIIAKVQSVGGAPNKPTATGVGAGGQPAPSPTRGDVTLEQFSKMNIGERSGLYSKNPTLYNKLFAEASAKRML